MIHMIMISSLLPLDNWIRLYKCCFNWFHSLIFSFLFFSFLFFSFLFFSFLFFSFLFFASRFVTLLSNELLDWVRPLLPRYVSVSVLLIASFFDTSLIVQQICQLQRPCDEFKAYFCHLTILPISISPYEKKYQPLKNVAPRPIKSLNKQ